MTSLFLCQQSQQKCNEDLHTNIHGTLTYQCVKLHRLVQLLTITDCHQFNTFNIDDFFHLLSEHDNDQSFEHIYNYFGGFCNSEQCAAFKRHYSNNTVSTQRVHVSNRLIDAVHCHYRHCYDIGHRFSFQEKKIINDTIIESKNTNQFAGNELDVQYLINPALFAVKDIIKNKTARKQYERLNKGVITKYNQLYPQKDQKNNKMYSFGYEFEYGYKEEIVFEPVKVFQKYKSLKYELISNPIYTITMGQFKDEYEVAKVKQTSNYCKKLISSTMEQLSIEHILCLICYCNYSELQYQLSKTYREHYSAHHKNFYHWGKLLKIVIHEFGTSTNEGAIKAFYHGIGEELIFPRYVGHNTRGIFINAPVSTSSSLEVAANFTNNNNGLIIEFGAVQAAYKCAKYFSVSWISKFSNEQEYLFVQNNFRPMEIFNIIHSHYAYELNSVLFALKVIWKLTWNSWQMKQVNDLLYYHQNANECIPSKIKTLVLKIFDERLNSNSKQSELSMFSYANAVISTYFLNQTHLRLNYSKMKTVAFSFVFNLIWMSECEWIKMEDLITIYPNIEYITISYIQLSPLIFDEILNYLKRYPETMLKQITICGIDENSEFGIKQAICEYEYEFEKIQFVMHYLLFIEKKREKNHLDMNCNKIRDKKSAFDAILCICKATFFDEFGIIVSRSKYLAILQ